MEEQHNTQEPHQPITVIEQQDVSVNQQYTRTKKSPKKIIAAAVILLVVAIGTYAILTSKSDDGKKDTATSQSAASDAPTTAPTSAKSLKAKDLYYFYKESQEGVFTLYRRPVGGGERVKVSEINGSVYPDFLDSNDDGFLYSVDSALWYVRYGANPKKVIEIPVKGSLSQSIVSGKFYKGNAKVLYSLTTDYDKGNATIHSVNIDGSNDQTLYTPTKTTGALLIDGWDGDKIAYVRPTCWNCDGLTNITAAQKIDLGTGKQIDDSPFSDKEAENMEMTLFTKDASKAYYYLSTSDKAVSGSAYEGLGGYGHYVGAPYALYLRTISSGTDTLLKDSLGSKEVMQKDSSLFYHRSIGFDATGGVYAAFNNQLYSLKNDKPSLLYEVDAPYQIYKVIYIDDQQAVVALSNPKAGTSDSPVYQLDLSTKKATKLMSATLDTTVYGGVSRE